MARREGARMRHVDERLRLGVDERRALSPDPLAQAVRERVRSSVGGNEQTEEPGPPHEDRQKETCRNEDESLAPDPREVDEEPVQPPGAVMDDPALEVPVRADQVGSSCLVWSISSCGLNGLPMKPCAPRDSASAAARSSTLPLNMITGIAPTPCRSCSRWSISQPSTPGIITSSRTRSGVASSSTRSPSSPLSASRTE